MPLLLTASWLAGRYAKKLPIHSCDCDDPGSWAVRGLQRSSANDLCGWVRNPDDRSSGSDHVPWSRYFWKHADRDSGAESTGYEGWVDYQLTVPATLHRPQLETWNEPGNDERTVVWWETSVNAPDQLRQRVAFALSQIFVVSDQNDDLGGQPIALANYYDMLLQNAFGNYRDLLEDVTLTPVMGVYLSMFRSTRVPDLGIEPDENYAREIMQLFSIGLVELNLDGTVLTDGSGTPIPTYNQDQIVALAEAFTGWNFAGAEGDDGNCQPWEWQYPEANWLQPMEPCIITDPWSNGQGQTQQSSYHVTSAKTIVTGHVLAANQTAEQDMQEALDVLANHPNVGPFIATRLIQRLVTSNPTPDYVRRVATVFNNNGSGQRGDLGAVVKAILMDSEALNLSGQAPVYAGRLREPLLGLTHLFRAYGQIRNDPCFDRNNDDCQWLAAAGVPSLFFSQGPLSAPSVFNFFRADYAQPGNVAGLNLVSPEFQIATETQVLDHANLIYNMMVPPGSAPPRFDWRIPYRVDFDPLLTLAENPAELVDRIATDLIGEPLANPGRQAIIDRLNQIDEWLENSPWMFGSEGWQYPSSTTVEEATALRRVGETIYFVATSRRSTWSRSRGPRCRTQTRNYSLVAAFCEAPASRGCRHPRLERWACCSGRMPLRCTPPKALTIRRWSACT